MNGIVKVALARPLTFIVMAILIALVGALTAMRTPVDIFPNIRVPVVATAWQYAGLSPDDMSGRIITPFERVLTTTVNDIDHIESTSMPGIGVVKIYFQPGADIRTATAQVTSVSQTVLKQLPPGITPPLILNYNASTVPIIQLALSGKGMSEGKLFDLAQNSIRPALVTVPGAAIPYPSGGRTRQIQLDLDTQALQSKGLSAQDVGNAIAAQNQINPAGFAKIGGFQYNVQLNNAPGTIDELNNIPVKVVNGATVYMRDVAHVRDGTAPQTNVVHVDGSRSVLMTILKNGATSTLAIVQGIKDALPAIAGDPARRAEDRADRRSVGVREGGGGGRDQGRRDRGGADRPDDPAVPGFVAIDGDHRDLDSAGDPVRDHRPVRDRADAQHHDAGRPRAGGRHPGRRRDGDDREHQLASRAWARR